MSGAGQGPLELVVVGHVDHGKSTLIGRLLHDTGSLPEGRLPDLEAMCRRRGTVLEWSFVLDALQAERDQAVTIDTTRIGFRSARRRYVLIDAPGHREFLRHMIAGAASAAAALLVVDAAEGVREQTRRHAYLLHLLGIERIVVAVNKMDVAAYDQARFHAVAADLARHFEGLGIVPAAVVPVAARLGENLVSRSDAMRWHRGPTLLEALDRLPAAAAPAARPLRLPIQDVYRRDEKRVLVGRVESGTLRVGDELLFLPGGRTARVLTLEAWGRSPRVARTGDAVGLTIDQPLFVERGALAAHGAAPPTLVRRFRATLFWLSDRPLAVGGTYAMRLGTATVPVTVAAVERALDPVTLDAAPSAAVGRDDIAEVVLRAGTPVALDPHRVSPATGRFLLCEGPAVVAGGIVAAEPVVEQVDIHPVDHLLTANARAWRNGHKGAVIWLTGLSGSGKSTLAMMAEKALFARGFQVYVLDGDNVRRGLSQDLAFGPEDRAENIRRVGEVAALFADAGLVVITAFISPYRADRERARRAAGAAFHEVYLKASLEACEARDPKGLYRRARAGRIAEFTGVSAPYEVPEQPDLVLDTGMLAVEACVDQLVSYVERATALDTTVASTG